MPIGDNQALLMFKVHTTNSHFDIRADYKYLGTKNEVDNKRTA